MAAHGGVKVAAGVNLVHQLPHHGGAGLPLIARVAGQHCPPVIVQGVQGHHVAIVVIVHLDLRVHTQEYGADAAAVLLLKRGGLAGGLGERGRSGATPTGSQGSQSQGGSQGQAKQFDAEVLFHFIHLLKNSSFVVCSDFRLRSCGLKTGVAESFFIFFGLHWEDTVFSLENRGRR